MSRFWRIIGAGAILGLLWWADNRYAEFAASSALVDLNGSGNGYHGLLTISTTLVLCLCLVMPQRKLLDHFTRESRTRTTVRLIGDAAIGAGQTVGLFVVVNLIFNGFYLPRVLGLTRFWVAGAVEALFIWLCLLTMALLFQGLWLGFGTSAVAWLGTLAVSAVLMLAALKGAPTPAAQVGHYDLILMHYPLSAVFNWASLGLLVMPSLVLIGALFAQMRTQEVLDD